MKTKIFLKNIDTLIQKQQYKKISNVLQNMIDIEIDQYKSIQEALFLFSNIYDKLYYYIIFNKLLLDKKIVRQLESLAMPLQSKTEEEWVELLRKIHKAKK